MAWPSCRSEWQGLLKTTLGSKGVQVTCWGEEGVRKGEEGVRKS